MNIEDICSRISQCTKCQLGINNGLPTIPVVGSKAQVMFIGEAGGADEQKAGKPFVGRSGKLLQKALIDSGFTRETVYITNAVKHRPPENRQPTDEELSACQQHLIDEISYVLPQVICCLGKTASIAVADIMQHKSLPKANLRAYSYTHSNMLVVHTWHPAYVLRTATALPQLEADLLSIYQRIYNGSSNSSNSNSG